MKKVLAILMCSLSFQMQALEYEQQYENDQVCIGKVTIAAHEEIGLHRDMHPEVVIALKGGTITRLETDGRTIDVKFPTGEAIFREADPENEQHRSVNNSSEPMELIIIQFKNSQSINQIDSSILPPTFKSKIGSKEPENRQKLITGIGSNEKSHEIAQ